MELEAIRAEAARVFDTCIDELAQAGNLEEGSVIVLGCSTSEVAGARIGKGSVPELVSLSFCNTVCWSSSLFRG